MGNNGSTSWDDIGLPQNFDQLLPAKFVPTSIPLRKPRKHEWVRTHPEWEQRFATLRLDGERDDLWVLVPQIVPFVSPDMVGATLFVPTINRQGAVAMWPLRLPATNGKHDEWARTALSIARTARTTWVQVHSNTQIGAYEYLELAGTASDPTWPTDFTWDHMRELAFRARLIDTPDHPILQAVLGKA